MTLARERGEVGSFPKELVADIAERRKDAIEESVFFSRSLLLRCLRRAEHVIIAPDVEEIRRGRASRR